MKIYYGRIVQARDLRRHGLSVRQIADRLGADAPAVRSWIGTNTRSARLPISADFVVIERKRSSIAFLDRVHRPRTPRAVRSRTPRAR
jgi:predicted transcriptional regulator